MTDLDLPTLRAILARATPQEWSCRTGSTALSVNGPDCRIYAVARDRIVLQETWDRQRADAQLIVSLRNAADALLAAVEERDRLKDTTRHKCPRCKTGTNSPECGGNAVCFHCGSCAYVACADSHDTNLQIANDDLRAECDRLRSELTRVTAFMDRAGGDRDGMPECPWCKYGPYGDDHASDCALVHARAALASPPEEGQ